MNPFADEDHLGNYSLYRVDKNTGVLSSVIKCKSMLTTKLTVDEGSLKNCHEYSQNKCSEWLNFINKESGLVNGDMEKARECTDLFAKIDRARLRAVQIFQGDLKNSQKDLETQFDDSTRADKGLRIAASVKVTSSKPHPTLLKYEDLIDHSSECASNAAWFEKDQRHQEYLRRLFATSPTKGSSSTPPSKGKPGSFNQ
ncbi:hypothetical protein K2P97_05645 [bacterium]|nr:hypothetical protein [bacterium]